MTEQARVTVILPVRNREQYLREALDSVVAQTYPAHQILVIDGHSTDSSPAIAASYQEVTLVPQQDTGVYQAMNLGVRLATGNLIAFIGSDDTWTPNKLRLQVDYLNKHPAAMMVIGHVQFFVEPGHTLPSGFNPILLEQSVEGHMPEVVLIRREVYDQVGMYDESYEQAGDVDWFTRSKDLGIVPEVMPDLFTHKRLHDSNLMAGAEKNNRELLRIMRRSVERQRASSN